MALRPGPSEGVNVSITAKATNSMPRELERLGLTETQRAELRQILTRGRDRVLSVVHDFEPRMKAAMDTTEIEINAVLTETQRAAWVIKGPDGSKTIRKN
jgi:hypothetical protein